MINEDESLRAFFTRVSLLQSEATRIVEDYHAERYRLLAHLAERIRVNEHFIRAGGEKGNPQEVTHFQGRKQEAEELKTWIEQNIGEVMSGQSSDYAGGGR